ncbi:MAG: hypothetical protein ACR2I0_04950, partial [Rhodoferax sp.]
MQSPLRNWRFFRAGGFDQVRLETAAELLALPELDQKLWVALSCPVKGIEFDARTLFMVDTDSDGHVRAPELIAAVQWAAARLKSPDVLVHQLAGVPLQAIRDDDEVGQRIAAAARDVLADAGNTDGLVSVDVASAAQARFASGSQPAGDQSLAGKLPQESQRALDAWEAAGAQAQTLGAATQAAHAALVAVADKVDDWFVRSRMVAFDARAGAALNASTEALAALGSATLSQGSDTIAALPLAQVTAQAVLPLVDGINPAWAQRLAALRADVALPLLGERTALTESDWIALKAALAPYAAWLASRPDPSAQGVGVRELEQLARYVR